MYYVVYSSYFSIGNGTRQGGVLSPYLFTRYIRELINTVAKMNIGCKIAGQMVNIVARGRYCAIDPISGGPGRGPTGPKGAHKDGPIKQLARTIIVDYSAISSGFTDVVTALLLFLTLPVTVATAERSFSKLRGPKLIKNYLRNTMGQERLSGLSLLAIEASQAKTMQTD